MVLEEVIEIFANNSKCVTFDFVLADQVFGNQLQLDEEQLLEFQSELCLR